MQRRDTSKHYNIVYCCKNLCQPEADLEDHQTNMYRKTKKIHQNKWCLLSFADNPLNHPLQITVTAIQTNDNSEKSSYKFI